MTPERWEKVKEVFDSALRVKPPYRDTFLANACADESLRREVASLIEAHEKSGTFIDSPAYEAAAGLLADETPDLKPGQQIAAYRIISFVSRGGMGEVYLAQDLRLNRRVALKILPESHTRDLDRLRRFEQEAHAVSALNHPNIVTIHEILQSGRLHVIVTEFVEGETLSQRLSRESLELTSALNIAIQIADALAASHAAGIVHRDIKPENVMLRPDGYVKVLDFGLAKLAEQAPFAVTEEAPTRQVRTGSGMVLGTADYMSPEQARGKTVDTRSDIFSLGAVLYEMVANRKPFEGETPSDTLAAILKTDAPPLAQAAPATPLELVRIVTKALRKDPDERYQVVKDLLLDLKSLKEDLDFQAKLDRSVAPAESCEAIESTISAPTSIARTPRSETDEIKTAVSAITHSLKAEIRQHKAASILIGVVVAVLLVTGAVALYRFLRARRDLDNKPLVLGQLPVTFAPGLDIFPSLSPDGKSIAYSSDQSGSFEIYVKQLTPGGGELQLTNDGKQNSHPAWSPDGQRIAYHSANRGGIWLVSSLGGAPRQITEFGARPAWSPDGSKIAFQSGFSGVPYDTRAMPPSTIWVVPSQGGTLQQITRPGNPPGGHSSPSWSPDGTRIAFQEADYYSSSCWLIAVASGEIKKLAPGSEPIYAPDGEHVYFLNERLGGLLQIQVSSSGDPIGEPTKVMAGGAGVTMMNPAISADGRKIVYSANKTSSNLWVVPLSAATAEVVNRPVAFSRDTSPRNTLPRFSPDGRKVACSSWRLGTRGDIWVADSDGSNLTQLTKNPANDAQSSWFPDSNKIAFFSDRDNDHYVLWTISLTTGKEERFLDLGKGVEFAVLSPDAEQVAFNFIQNGAMNVWVANVKDGQRRQLTFDDQLMGFPCWSPDSKLIAFERRRGEEDELMIIPSAGGQPTQLTFDHKKNWSHSWSRDGDKIAFAGRRNGIWNIYWISRSTKQQRQLTNYSKLNSFVRYPTWSPLGNQMVYEYVEVTGNIWLIELK